MVHVDSNSGNRQVRRVFLRPHFYKHARHFLPIDINVIGRFNVRGQEKLFVDGVGNCFRCPRSESRRLTDFDLRPEKNREPKAFVHRRFPTIAALAAAVGLMFRENDQAFGR